MRPPGPTKDPAPADISDVIARKVDEMLAKRPPLTEAQRAELRRLLRPASTARSRTAAQGNGESR
jgi:hypothetical protein